MGISLIEYLYPMSPILVGALLMLAIKSFKLKRRNITIYHDESSKTMPECIDSDQEKTAMSKRRRILQDFAIVNGTWTEAKRNSEHMLLYDDESRPCMVTHERTILLKRLFSKDHESAIMLFSIASYRLRIVDNYDSIG